MAMMINAKVVGYGPDPETTKALVNIIVEFSGPTERFGARWAISGLPEPLEPVWGRSVSPPIQ
jgi:hypothetical protein